MDHAVASAEPTSVKAPLGEILVQKGLINEDELEQALAHQKERGLKLGQALVELDLVCELEVAKALHEQGRIPSIQLSPPIIDEKVAERLGPQLSWDHSVIAVNQIAGQVTVALQDPTDSTLVGRISNYLGCPVFPVYSGLDAIQTCLEEVFPKGFDAPSDLDDIILRTRQLDPPTHSEEDGLFSIEDESQGENPVIPLVRGLIEDALGARASDIHFEPRPDRFAIRFRIDGSLVERLSLAPHWSSPILSRLKVMANLDIAQRRAPQDGRIQIRIQDRPIDLRIATAPSLNGEGGVIRILDGGRRVFSVEQLGMCPEQLATLRRIITSRAGFVLATGPTGAGKTTTLYSLLRQLDRSDRKIITLEDPVENALANAYQISTNPQVGLSFAKGLRSVLRLDPDIILVGEIRDLETARIAVQAALTGHLVLSTLSSIGTSETLTRLTDMGVERCLLGDTIRGIVAQRLLKRICPQCRTEVHPAMHQLEAAGLDSNAGPFFEGEGCSQCLNTGYKGRIGVYEVLEVTSAIYTALSSQGSALDLRRAALSEGMITMREDAIKKALRGDTTLNEVIAATSGRPER